MSLAIPSDKTPGQSLTQPPFPLLSAGLVREALLANHEIALIDVREEETFAGAHPLWAANFPLSRLELDAWERIPRRDTLIVVYGESGGVDLAPRAAQKLVELGYSRVHLLADGLTGWITEGYEVFKDVNVPSKAFGELIAKSRQTPMLAAEEVKALLDSKANAVIFDVRRFDEYQTMNIPGSLSVPGAELVLRAREIAPDPQTRIIVNCAGRTRSIIGTQSLLDAGLPNPIAALRNGTIGWTLAGFALEHGASRSFPADLTPSSIALAQADALALAKRAGARQITAADLASLETVGRTTYRFDVRGPQDYSAGHLPGFINAPGGQLVQETDHFAPVRGARIVLMDDDGVRANMTAAWLRQMDWDVYALSVFESTLLSETGHRTALLPEISEPLLVEPSELAAWLNDEQTTVFDFTTSANYVKRHIPSAWFVLRSELARALTLRPQTQRYVLTCGTGLLARFAAQDLKALSNVEIFVVKGGTTAWIEAGLPLEKGESRLASEFVDRYRRPYEGINNSFSAMQDYLDWEDGLVAQIERDGTHHFKLL